MDDCLFCKFIRKDIAKEFILESEKVVAFADIDPAADVHILIVPKEHISGVEALGRQHGELLADIYGAANKLVALNNLKDNLYRIVVNGGKAQHVPHLHFHLLGGKWKKAI